MTEEEWRDSVDQLTLVIIWLVRQIAEQNEERLSSAAQRLVLKAPNEYTAQTISIVERTFREKGL